MLLLRRRFSPLLHLQSQQVCLGTTDALRILSILLIEPIATVIQSIDLRSAFVFFVAILC
jgi:hypothetical protein